jgi:tRNA isopentenyl-2-thiomethyl-A-37 hydroxylase MiaE
MIFHDRLTFPVVAVAFLSFHFLALQLLEARNVLLRRIGPCRFAAALSSVLVPGYPILKPICSLNR